MSDSTFRDFKRFTRERLNELASECEANLSECVRLLEMLVEDAKEMAKEETVSKIEAQHKHVLEVVEQISDLLLEVRV